MNEGKKQEAQEIIDRRRITAITKILDAHFIPYYVSGGRIYADTMEGGTDFFEKTEDLTDFTRTELYDWLSKTTGAPIAPQTPAEVIHWLTECAKSGEDGCEGCPYYCHDDLYCFDELMLDAAMLLKAAYQNG